MRPLADPEKADFEAILECVQSMSPARLSRLVAIMALYWLEYNPIDVHEVLTQIRTWLELDPAHPGVKQAQNLIELSLKQQPDLDALISSCTERWSPKRISPVIQNILRVALVEMTILRRDPALIINEAVELTKLLAEDDAYRFVNGILDHLHKQPLTEDT